MMSGQEREELGRLNDAAVEGGVSDVAVHASEKGVQFCLVSE